MPSGPKSFSINSRTSRPRSPTKATTTTSASDPRAIIPIRVDLPTPEPANKPRRWPRPSGTKASMARTPVAKVVLIRCRRNGWGGVLAVAVGAATGSKPWPSKGRPSASRTRPSISGPGRGKGGRSSAATSQPTCSPVVSPSGINSTRCSRKPTTSACKEKLPRADRNKHNSPSPTLGPSDSMIKPVTAVTVPKRCTVGRCRTWERMASTRGATAAFMRSRGNAPGRRV